jgi:hypothetical protein
MIFRKDRNRKTSKNSLQRSHHSMLNRHQFNREHHQYQRIHRFRLFTRSLRLTNLLISRHQSRN